jgi:hypothetical protein
MDASAGQRSKAYSARMGRELRRVPANPRRAVKRRMELARVIKINMSLSAT